MKTNFYNNSSTFCGSRTTVIASTKKVATSLKSDNRKLNSIMKQLNSLEQGDAIEFDRSANSLKYSAQWTNSKGVLSEVVFSTHSGFPYWNQGTILGKIDIVESKGNKVTKTNIGIFKENVSKIKQFVDVLVDKATKKLDAKYKSDLKNGINKVLNVDSAPKLRGEDLPL